MSKNELPDWIDKTVWKEFKNHRNRLRKPMTLYAEHRVLLRCERAKNNGFDPNECLNDAIEKGWQTIFPKPKHLGNFDDPAAPPPMYRGSVLNPDYQEWLANKEFMEIDGTSDTSSSEEARIEAMRSLQRAKLEHKTPDLAGKIKNSKPRCLN